MQNPRKPTIEELQQVVAMLTQEGNDPEWAVRLIQGLYIAVFEDHISSPDYIGKVMIVAWTAMPVCYGVFTWDTDNTMRFRPCSGYSGTETIVNIPTVQGYSVNEKLREFHKLTADEEGQLHLEVIAFDSEQGKKFRIELLKTLDADDPLFKKIAARFYWRD